MSKKPISKVDALLNRPFDSSYLKSNAKFFALKKEENPLEVKRLLFFRLGKEWFAISESILSSISSLKKIRKIPHHRSSLIQGVVNVGGQLLTAINLHQLLHVEKGQVSESKERSLPRLVVFQKEQEKWVALVDEIYGFQTIETNKRSNIPATVDHSPKTYVTSMLNWRGIHVGLLDHEKLLKGLEGVFHE